MGATETEILQMLQRYSPDLQAVAHELRSWIWGMFPESNEVVYDKKNLFATGWSLSDSSTDIFVSFAVYNKHINLGFTHGNLLHDPRKLLKGDGVQFRHYRMPTMDQFPYDYFEQMILEAQMNAIAMLKPNKAKSSGQILIKQRRETSDL